MGLESRVGTCTFEDIWLIQRLCQPITGKPNSMLAKLGKDNPFAFGGGYKNGGIPDEAMDLLRDIWSFDYMGASEFEHGNVASALHHLAKTGGEGKLTTFNFKMKPKDFDKHYGEKLKDPLKDMTVYVICNSADILAVEQLIRRVAKGKQDLKERTALSYSMFREATDTTPNRVSGWLVLEQPSLFFTDEEMFKKAKKLFVDQEEESK